MSFIRVCASFNRPLHHRPTANHRAEEQLRKQNTRNRNYLAWMVNRKDELSFEDRVRLPSCQIFHLRSKFFLLFICCKHPVRLCFRNKASFRPVVYNSSIASQPVVTFSHIKNIAGESFPRVWSELVGVLSRARATLLDSAAVKTDLSYVIRRVDFTQ